jgi:MSHA biogenesis protein MshO
MAQDIQNSVPNSVRVSGNFIEMVPILNAAPYRSAPSAAPGSDALNFSAPDQSFHILDDMISTNTTYNDGQIVIYNLGLEAGGVPVLGSNLFASNPSTLPHVISPAGLTVSNNGNEDLVTLDTPHQFAQSSPDQRFYLVRGALTYHCNPAAGTLQRYQGYSIQQNQPTSAASAPLASAASALLANRVAACGFSYSQGSLSRNSVISLRLTMSDGDQSFSLLRQVQVSNVP